jgi:hypothetical protein
MAAAARGAAAVLLLVASVTAAAAAGPWVGQQFNYQLSETFLYPTHVIQVSVMCVWEAVLCPPRAL